MNKEVLDYPTLMEHLVSLPTFSIVTGGRAGSDFLQSVFDSHPEVLTFNGWFQFHELFWNESYCVKTENFELSDLVDEFIGKLIYKLKSRYDIQEKKDKLGLDNNQSIDIDLKEFKKHVLCLMQNVSINSKNILTVITASYALCLKQDLFEKKIILHHPHLAEYLQSHIADFPNTKLIYMVRDPRANIVSGYENFGKYYPDKSGAALLNAYLTSILYEDISIVTGTQLEYRILRVEDLDQKEVYLKLCDWMGINYCETMTSSTWAGLLWHGDRLTRNKVDGLSRDVLKNNWQNKLSNSDKYIISHLTKNMRQYYKYEEEDIKTSKFKAFFIIIKPLSYEIDNIFRNINSAAKSNKTMRRLYNFYFYFVRVRLFYKLLFSPVTFDNKDYVLRK